MFSAIGLKKTYHPKHGPAVHALKGVSIDFGDTGMVFVLGKSGSGKSTLLHILGGLDYADEGELVLDGKSTKNFSFKDFDDFRNESVGFVFQEYNLLPTFNVRENLAVALELQGKAADAEKIASALRRVELEGMESRKPNELSGGQKQRVAIARALVKDPKIILADEPTGALDAATGNAILTLLKELSDRKLVIVVSHDREFAEKYGDRIIELADGEIVRDSAANVPEKDVKPNDGAGEQRP